MEMLNKWHVIYSKPRWEKKTAKLLAEQGLTVYCPMNRCRRRWSDRIKIVEMPLFTSYVFVKIEQQQQTVVRQTPGVVNFVYSEGKPAIVQEKEIEKIQRFLSEYEEVTVLQEIEKNQRVMVSKGLLLEKEGKVIDLQNKKVKVALDSLGYTLVAVFDKAALEMHTGV